MKKQRQTQVYFLALVTGKEMPKVISPPFSTYDKAKTYEPTYIKQLRSKGISRYRTNKLLLKVISKPSQLNLF